MIGSRTDRPSEDSHQAINAPRSIWPVYRIRPPEYRIGLFIFVSAFAETDACGLTTGRAWPEASEGRTGSLSFSSGNSAAASADPPLPVERSERNEIFWPTT